MSKHKDNHLELRGHKHPLIELTTITITKPVDQFTNFDHLLVGQLLEEMSRVKRQGDAYVISA